MMPVRRSKRGETITMSIDLISRWAIWTPTSSLQPARLIWPVEIQTFSHESDQKLVADQLSALLRRLASFQPIIRNAMM